GPDPLADGGRAPRSSDGRSGTRAGAVATPGWRVAVSPHTRSPYRTVGLLSRGTGGRRPGRGRGRTPASLPRAGDARVGHDRAARRPRPDARRHHARVDAAEPAVRAFGPGARRGARPARGAGSR